MSAGRRTLIRTWFEWNMFTQRYPYERPAGVRDSHGLLLTGDRLHASGPGGGAPLAEVVRREGPDRPPLVHLNLPNFATISRHREIREVLEGMGAQVFAVPQAILHEADIRPKSIEVIDTERKPRLFRAPQQLIRAKVIPLFSRNERSAYFLSGYDLNEPGLSYFFCELPPDAEPKTLEEAYQALKPRSVKVAEAQGKRVRRQGDIFFIEMDRALRRDFDVDHMGKPTAWAYIYQTNHTAEYRSTDRATGLTYVRGRIKHDPFGRRRDHHTLHLGYRKWWLAVKNTVPVIG